MSFSVTFEAQLLSDGKAIPAFCAWLLFWSDIDEYIIEGQPGGGCGQNP